MVTSASRSSYSPDSRVRTSRPRPPAAARRARSRPRPGWLDRPLPARARPKRQIVKLGSQVDHPIDVGLQDRQPRGHPLGVVRVVPQVGRGDLLLQLGDLGPLAIRVDDSLDRAQSLIKVSERAEKSGPATTVHSTPGPTGAGLQRSPPQSRSGAVGVSPRGGAPRSGRTGPRRSAGAGGQSLTQITTNAASEQARATTGPSTKSQTTTSPTRSSGATTSAPRLVSWPCRPRQAAYAIQGTMADRIATQAKIDMPPSNAPDASRTMATRLTRPVKRPEGHGEVLVQHAYSSGRAERNWSSQHRTH